MSYTWGRTPRPLLPGNHERKGETMIITKEQADKWIAEGRAIVDGVTNHDGRRWAIVTDYQEQTVNHYELDD